MGPLVLRNRGKGEKKEEMLHCSSLPISSKFSSPQLISPVVIFSGGDFLSY